MIQFGSYHGTLRAQKWLSICVACWLCQQTVVVTKALGCHEIPEASDGTCSQGNTLLQLASKPSRTVATVDEADRREEVKQPMAVAATALSHAASTARFQIAMRQATQMIQRSLESAQQARAFFGVSMVVLLCLLGLCMVCIIVRMRSDSYRRQQFPQGGNGRLSATFGQMPPNPAARLLQKTGHPSSQSSATQSFGYRGGVQSMHAPTLMTGTSSLRTLCPGLVVPESSDCVLVIRMLPKHRSTEGDFDAAAGRGSIGNTLEHQILDLEGRAVLQASTVQPWPKQGQTGVTLRTLRAPRGADSSWLSLCRSGSAANSVYIYDKDDALFGSMQRDRTASRYVLHGNSGETLLAFDGSFEEHRVSIMDSHNNMVAHAEPRRMDFEPDGKFYQARIAAGVDVGIVLSGLLSIDAMEACDSGTPIVYR